MEKDTVHAPGVGGSCLFQSQYECRPVANVRELSEKVAPAGSAMSSLNTSPAPPPPIDTPTPRTDPRVIDVMFGAGSLICCRVIAPAAITRSIRLIAGL